MNTVLVCLVSLVLSASTAFPHNNGISVVTPGTPASMSSGPRSGAVIKPQVHSLRVRTDIRSRYARTLVTSVIANPADRSQEVTFDVTIPETAFVSKFVMQVGNETMEGAVRERTQAKHEYSHAVQSGQTAGHVATASVRDASHVQISVNVAAMTKASFNLTYEELLTRRKGRYELVINLNPGQLVREMTADVYIQENTNITNLQVPSFRLTNEIDFDESESENVDANITMVSGNQAHVHFEPSIESQRKHGTVTTGNPERGLAGQFIVRYDVLREKGAGEILAFDGYFVHFFAPPELKPLPKHVIFVLDVSGSMHGHKIQQLREAMSSILGELKPGDYFNLVEFSYSVTVMDLESPSNSTVLSPSRDNWYSGSFSEIENSKRVSDITTQIKAFPANEEYITKAREAVRKMSAGGGTNIYDAVRAAIGVSSKRVPYDGADVKLPEPLIIFLTDGEATVGETRADKILELIDNARSVPLFTLAFGVDADLAFLKRLSLRAGAFARKIYEAADASLQLRDFYRQVASPLLSNVAFTYLETQVDGSSVTKQNFSLLFSGSELVVAGKLREANVDKLEGQVSGVAQNGTAVYPLIDSSELLPNLEVTTPPPQPGDRFLERLWAYMSIKQLLERYDAVRDDVHENIATSAQSAKSQALELALKFSFVTPVTSLVVVKQNSTKQQQINPSIHTATTTGTSPVAMQQFSSNLASGPFTSQVDSEEESDQTMSLSLSAARPPRPSGAIFGVAQQAVSKVDHHTITDRLTGGGSPFTTTRHPASHPTTLRLTTTTLPPRTTYNLTRVNIDAVSWLHVQNEYVNNEWQNVHIANSSQVYKLLYANQSDSVGEAVACTPPAALNNEPWTCRPLVDCVLAAFADQPQEYLQSFQCFIGNNRYLGACCPESAEVTTAQEASTTLLPARTVTTLDLQMETTTTRNQEGA